MTRLGRTAVSTACRRWSCSRAAGRTPSDVLTGWRPSPTCAPGCTCRLRPTPVHDMTLHSCCPRHAMCRTPVNTLQVDSVELRRMMCRLHSAGYRNPDEPPPVGITMSFNLLQGCHAGEYGAFRHRAHGRTVGGNRRRSCRCCSPVFQASPSKSRQKAHPASYS